MAKKSVSLYVCQNCGATYPRWQRKCDSCGEWNTIVEEVQKTDGFSKINPRKEGKIIDFVPLKGEQNTYARLQTGIKEIDRVTGGGLVPGSVILVGGDPGIGKSTLLLQVCAGLANKEEHYPCYYISGEEAIDQVRIRASRLGLAESPVNLASATDVRNIIATLEKTDAAVVIIDSIQTMYLDEVESTPGSVGQVRACAYELIKLAKCKGFVLFLVGHVTKQGEIAGPRVLEHMVDTVLYFEGDRHGSYRMLRGVKNRFGSTNEIGVFEMKNEGLVEVPNPSEFMLNGRPEDSSGSVVGCTMEGTRPILVEIQALVSKTNFGFPRRQSAGSDMNRLNLMMTVLEKRVGVQIGDCDAYVNIAGGMKITEPGVDLGIVIAVMSSYSNRVIPADVVAFGEVGLSGEVRAVSGAPFRVAECKKLGFKKVILPCGNMDACKEISGIEFLPVKSITQAINCLNVLQNTL